MCLGAVRVNEDDTVVPIVFTMMFLLFFHINLHTYHIFYSIDKCYDFPISGILPIVHIVNVTNSHHL
jgi:hypothetical protein